MKSKITGFFKDNRNVFISFFITVAAVVLAMAAGRVYPFGTEQIAVIDMYHQYLPFLSELQTKLQAGGSLFFSWDGGCGTNFWNLIAYYGASPLNLLLALFPKSMIMEAATVVLLIKLGLAASFMTMFLRYAGKRCDAGTVAFSMLYALCAYVMAYYWCIMWMDAVALLPLCMLGLYRLIDGRGVKLYTISLALIVFTNYYISIMVCIFILFYYPVLYFIRVRGGGARRCLVTAGKAAGFSLLGIAMSAVMLLPTYISMQDTYYISSDMPENWKFYNDPLDIINQLLPNAQLTVREGLPDIYCGLIVVILLVFFYISRTIPLREKVLDTVFLVFMFISLNLNKLDFIWHGFHFPNQLPYRYSFVISFLLVSIVYRTFLKADEFRIKTIWTVLAAGTGYYLLAQKILKGSIDDPDLFFYCGVAFLVLYCTVFLVYRKSYVRKNVFVFLIAVVVAAEMTAGISTAMDRNGTTSRTAYFEGYKDVSALAEQTDKEFARTEMTGNYILNCPALYHYKGVSQFSSSINGNTVKFMESIGLDGEPGKNRFNYNLTTPVINSMLNVKYLISRGSEIDDGNLELVKRQGSSCLYENRYPLAAGYMTSSSIRTWDTSSGDPFTVLDDYIRAATGGRYTGVFRRIASPQITSQGASVKENGSRLTAVFRDDADKGSVTLRYRAESTQNCYVFVEAGSASTITVRKGSDTDDISIRNDCGSIVDIGSVRKDSTFDIVIDYDDASGIESTITSKVCTMDMDLWDKAYSLLSKNTMEVTDWDDTHVTGSVTADEDGVLMTSIPYENGWKLKVDGSQRNISELAGGSLISVDLSKGTHTIELTFTPPGLKAGAAITAAAILLLAAMEVVVRRRRKQQHKNS